jgi:hypothetical protein
MALTNAKKQKRWRDRRNKLAKEAIKHRTAGERAPKQLRNQAPSEDDNTTARENAVLRERVGQLRNRIAELKGASKTAAPVTKQSGSQELGAKLEPLLHGLYEEGKKNMATMAPAQVAYLAGKLEQTLVEAGIIPPTKRTEKAG